MDTTYRVIDLAGHQHTGQTAATPQLAKLAVGNLSRFEDSRFAVEQTDWADLDGTPRVRRSVIIEAEDPADPWKVGR